MIFSVVQGVCAFKSHVQKLYFIFFLFFLLSPCLLTFLPDHHISYVLSTFQILKEKEKKHEFLWKFNKNLNIYKPTLFNPHQFGDATQMQPNDRNESHSIINNRTHGAEFFKKHNGHDGKRELNCLASYGADWMVL